MPEEKYVPNSSVMGGSRVTRKVTFFGRDKIGGQDATETPSEKSPDSPSPDSPTDETQPPSAPPASTSSGDAAPDAGRPGPGLPGDGLPYYGRSRAVDGVHPERRSAPGSPGPGSPGPDSSTVNLWSSLPRVEGHLRLPNVIVDHLYQLLDLQERSVYEQLYRLSHGYGNQTCRIGYPQLSVRAGMGRTATVQTVERLIKKGLIARVNTVVGGRKEQGSEYWVSAPGSSAPGSSGPGSPPPEPNKIKALKENIKKGGASHQKRDYSACPDCHGTGMWYPEGYDRGVARCRHLNLTG